MAEAKPTASLSSGLLARKGTARPAMRRQGLGGHVAGPHDDLGWNDMGHEPELAEREAHAAHVADIMPMLSPMGGKPVASRSDRDPHESDDGAEARDQYDDEPHDARDPHDAVPLVARSPLSVKPGKPQVVLQREALEDRVRAPAPIAPAHAERDIAAEPDVASDRAAPVEAEAPVPAAAPPVAERPQASPHAASNRVAEAPQRAPVRAPKPARPRRTVRAPGAKAAFTLRIDADRHLRLRLASAVTNMSAQQILIEAFDAYLETIPDVETLAGNVAGRGAYKP
jgi:hypothetical protein